MSRKLDLSSLGLDWETALRRFHRDTRDDFFPDPVSYRDLLADLERTARQIRAKENSFTVTRASSLDIPKASFTLRHALQLAPEDRILYQALCDVLIAVTDSKMADCAFSHRYRGPDQPFMFKNNIESWKTFRAAVRNAAAAGGFIVLTDLAQYYENVQFRYLRRQMESLVGSDMTPRIQRAVDELVKCLKRWSPYGWHGLPQNMDPSSFLGNVLLDSVDRRALREFAHYFRYMDDIRVVVADEAEARKVLSFLTVRLRELGLTMNARKTEIVPPDTERWCEVTAPEDAEIEHVETAIRSRDPGTIQGIVRSLVTRTHALVDEERTGETAFRFCVNRIVTLRRYRDLAWPDLGALTASLIQMLERRPCDTDMLARYLSVAPLSEGHRRDVVAFLVGSPFSIYPWQQYRLWLLLSQLRVADAALASFAHRTVAEGQGPGAVGACLYLGACGNYADRQALRGLYSDELGPSLRRAMLVAMQEVHRADRQPVYRAAREDDASGDLVSYLEGVGDPIYVPEPEPVEIQDLYDFTFSVY